MAPGEASVSDMEIEAACKSLHEEIHMKRPLTSLEGQVPSRGIDEENQRQEEIHIVVVPYPLQGHINPMMQFAKSLVAKYPVKVSFVNIKYHHDRIQKFHDAEPGSTQVAADSSSFGAQGNGKGKLQLVWIDNGLSEDFDFSALYSQIIEFHTAAIKMKDPFEELLISLNRRHTVSCVVFGSFCPWVHDVCAEHGISSFFFWTQSAVSFSIYYHMPLLEANGFFPYKKQSGCDNASEESKATSSELIHYVPGVPPLHPSLYPTLLHVDSVNDPMLETARHQFAIFPNCSGLIINSFEELEEDAYEALREKVPYPVSLVGPLVPSAFLEEDNISDTSFGSSLFHEKTDCIEWLNQQGKQSVLYISFGSIFVPSPEELQTLAEGIKRSQKPFVWVLRPSSATQTLAEILPNGFLEDTREQGLIIPWCSQVQVLSHPAVGAFLTHCGWNSTLESISTGVPLIAYPILSDQPLNAKFLCDFWNVGVLLRRNDSDTIESSAVEKKVRNVLEDGEILRKRCRELRDVARRAVQAHGSAHFHMEEFIRCISKGDSKCNEVKPHSCTLTAKPCEMHGALN
ncbi:hypothetical protein KP509_12G048200 [Ceratopteris richardii]|uniref:Glycosyltransferase n=1 Tax=Ceratopteris richardii TaxID=49495 RepID=A0A8T2TNK9_CERRI|nr:hypothetical protein KP509_12G048200 [Ceratopteris richardii]